MSSRRLVVSSSRRLVALIALALGATIGCGSEDEFTLEGFPGESSQAVSEHLESSSGANLGDHPELPPVYVYWGLSPADDAHVLVDWLDVVLVNTEGVGTSVDLKMHGMGLDQRSSYASIGKYALRAKERRTVRVRLADLPVQSVGAPGQIDLWGTSSGPDWAGLQLATSSLYVQFAPGYAKAFASVHSTWAPVALGLVDGNKAAPEYGELLEAPSNAVKARSAGGAVSDQIDPARAREMYERVVIPARRPRGRYLDEAGRFVEVVADTGGGMLVLESKQAEFTEAVESYGAEQDSRAPSGPTAERTVKLCAEWGVQFLDSGLGEDYLNGVGFQRYPSRYARAAIDRVSSPAGRVWTGYLNADGCIPNVSLSAGRYDFKRFANHKNPAGTVFVVTGDAPGASYYWPKEFVVDSGSGTQSVTTYTSNHAASRIAAVVSLLLSNWEPGLLAGKSYRLMNTNDDCGGAGAYSMPEHICLGNDTEPGTPHTTTSMVTIGHEIGHSVERDGAGLPYSSYNAPPSVPLCSCNHVHPDISSHCVQSLEYAEAAWNEGFGHFYAAKIFNEWRHTDCTFAYYKKVIRPFLGFNLTFPPPVPLSCKTPVRWMKTHCNTTNFIGGVEWDFMTFLWNIHAPAEYGNKRLSMPEYYSIKKRACTGNATSYCASGHSLNFQKFENAAFVHFGSNYLNLKYRHVSAMGIEHGVRNGNP